MEIHRDCLVDYPSQIYRTQTSQIDWEMLNHMKHLSRLISLVFAVAVLAGTVIAQDDVEALKQEAIETYADIVFASYEDSLELAIELNNALVALVESPSEETLENARTAWLASNEPYGQTEAYRFYGGPIDDEDGPEGLLNAWPLDEAYVDYVEGDEDAGIVNNLDDYPDITKDVLVSLNEVGAEENISTGYHAIEFLLWGQDLYEDSAGQRPFEDYSTNLNADRRGQYLLITGELLVENLEDMVAQWNPGNEDGYRYVLLDMSTDEAITKILTGIGVLAKSELSGDRIFTAYDNQDQEDEHSCFSDNTHRDIITNFMGIQNVYFGQYERLDGTLVEGTGLTDIFAVVNSDLNDEMIALLESTDMLVNEISIPFDRAIVDPDTRPTVFDTVFTLLDVGDKIVELAYELDLVIDTSLPAQ